MHKLRWDDLQFVLAVADQGSLAAAARLLGVNHATVLRRVSAFEARHSIELFERQANGYRLTPESKPILDSIRAVQATIDGLQRTMAGHGSVLEGDLRLTSTDSLCRAVLPRHIQRFQNSHPRMQIELRVTNSRLNFAQLDADITVRPAKELPADLTGEHVCDLAFRIYGAPAYFADNGSEDPARHRWLGLSNAFKDTPIGHWEDSIIPTEAVACRSDSFVTLCQLAELGMGLAMAPCCLGDLSPGLVRAPMFPTEIRTKLWVAAHPDMMRSPKIQSCIAFFADALRSDVALLHGETV